MMLGVCDYLPSFFWMVKSVIDDFDSFEDNIAVF